MLLVYKSTQLAPILRHMNSDNTVSSLLFKIHFNIILFI
jgi:hypothetical protein